MLVSSQLTPRHPSQPLRAGLAVMGGLGVFAAYFYFFGGNAQAESKDSASGIFSSGLGRRLRLASSEVVNHNTKLLRFELPEADAHSGLTLICKPSILLKDSE